MKSIFQNRSLHSEDKGFFFRSFSAGSQRFLTWARDLMGDSLHPAAAKSLQPCPTLCDPIDGSPPGSSIHGILQARTMEWGAIAFSVFAPQSTPNLPSFPPTHTPQQKELPFTHIIYGVFGKIQMENKEINRHKANTQTKCPLSVLHPLSLQHSQLSCFPFLLPCFPFHISSLPHKAP